MKPKPTPHSERLQMARINLLLDHPFFGQLLLNLEPVETRSVKTFSTDGRRLLYNPDFMDTLGDGHLALVLAHEILHCALLHPFRRGDRDLRKFNEAADYAINNILDNYNKVAANAVNPNTGRATGVEPFPFDGPMGDLLLDHSYDNLSAEEIYEKLKAKEKAEQPQPQPQAQPQQQQQQQKGQGGQQNESSNQQNQSPPKQNEPSPKQTPPQPQPPQPQGKPQPQPGQGQPSPQPGQGKPQPGQGQGKPQPGKGQPGPGQGQPQQQPGQPEQPDEGPPEPTGPGDFTDAQPEDGHTEQAEDEWKMAVQQAALVGKAAGRLPAEIERMVNQLLNPKVHWRQILRMFLTAVAKDDYNFARPNTRYSGCPFILPGLHSPKLGKVIVAVDTSGSIDQEQFNAFMSEARTIFMDCKPECLVLAQCDARLHAWDEFGPYDELEAKFKGGGGTSFVPVFDRALDEIERPAALIYLTDLEGSFPDYEPHFPVLWAVTGRKDKAPFGEVLSID